MEINRPKQHKQSSRKGKKAWIKNIDLEDLSSGLEKNRENLIKFGVESLDDIQSDNLFVVDTKGDDTLAPKTTKILKSTEILNKRSKVPGLENAHKKKDRISKKEVKRLMQIAGRDKLESSATSAIIQKEGLINTKAYDVWNQPEDPKEANKPQLLKKFSSTEWTKPTYKPKTLSEAPIQVRDFESVPNAGKSYNPSLESWKSLINQEYLTEKVKADKRQELEDHRIKLQGLLNNLGFNEEVDSEAEDEEDDDDEDEETSSKSLSINKPVIIKKKTKTQRNKQKRHQERVQLENELKQLKSKLHQLEKIPIYQKEIATTEITSRSSKEQLVKKRSKLGTKYQIRDSSIEVKLSDELTDSLRTLKPEGNLFYDAMIGLQSKGKIETRVQQKKKVRYQPKVTEKWTYKDFK